MIERSCVLVLGGNGMLGHTLVESLAAAGTREVHTTVRSIDSLQARERYRAGVSVHVAGDVQDFSRLTDVLHEVKPNVVVNCIGLVKQRSESADTVAMIEINSLFPQRLAVLCSQLGARLVHFSTDCVFSGAIGGYSEDDAADPVDSYGRSKLLGEPQDSTSLSLRTSIIGHELTSRHGLLEWFLSAHDRVLGFSRVIFSGLPTVEIARVVRENVLPHPELTGLYHLAAAPISKLRLLELIAQQYRLELEIEPTDEPRLDRSLDGGRFAEVTGYRAPSWPRLVETMYRDAFDRYPSRAPGPKTTDVGIEVQREPGVDQ